MKPGRIALFVLACGVVGAATGALLATYWWDFPPEDDAYDFLVAPFYGTLGFILGLLAAPLLLAGRAIVSRFRESLR